MVTIVFWTSIHTSTLQLQLTWQRKLNLIIDHFVPLLALLTDYCMNCQPIIRRHFLVVIIIAFIYILVLMGFSISGYPPYPNMNWDSWRGTLIPILILFLTIVLFFLLEVITKRKLKWIGGDQNLKILSILGK